MASAYSKALGMFTCQKTTFIVALIILATLLSWLLWPVQIILEGKGIVQPVFEKLVPVVPPDSGVVCMVAAERLKEVRTGDTLLEYIPIHKAQFLSYTKMTEPGGNNEPEPLPNWYRELETRRVARSEAASQWQQATIRQQNPNRWERNLANRFALLARIESDMERIIAQQRENIRLGHEAANSIHVFDEALGQSIPAQHGIALASPASGMVYSFWALPVMQTTAAIASNLPVPAPGSTPMSAIGAGTAGTPIAEIIPPNTPREVLALVPRMPYLQKMKDGWEQAAASNGMNGFIVTMIEFGGVPVVPAQAKLLIPKLAIDQDAVFVRLQIKEESSAKLDDIVQVRLVSPSRPRIWYWMNT